LSSAAFTGSVAFKYTLTRIPVMITIMRILSTIHFFTITPSFMQAPFATNGAQNKN
jgi:hypothetical protein